jgi:transposase
LVDAAHLVLAPFLGVLRSVTRLFGRAPAGRQRFNVLGALNAVTQELLTVPHATYITATEGCALWRQVAALHLGIPLTAVLDNARYHRCAQVVTLATNLPLELCFLPPSSPTLNLLERLWQFVKKQCLSSTYYPDFAAFKTALGQCWAQTPTTHRVALDSLLTLRFQRFEKAHFLPV